MPKASMNEDGEPRCLDGHVRGSRNLQIGFEGDPDAPELFSQHEFGARVNLSEPRHHLSAFIPGHTSVGHSHRHCEGSRLVLWDSVDSQRPKRFPARPVTDYPDGWTQSVTSWRECSTWPTASVGFENSGTSFDDTV